MKHVQIAKEAYIGFECVNRVLPGSASFLKVQNYRKQEHQIESSEKDYKNLKRMVAKHHLDQTTCTSNNNEGDSIIFLKKHISNI